MLSGYFSTKEDDSGNPLTKTLPVMLPNTPASFTASSAWETWRRPLILRVVILPGNLLASRISSNHARELARVPNKYRYLYCSSGLRKYSKAVCAGTIGHQCGVAELYTRDALTQQHYGQGSSSSLNRRLLFDARKPKTLQF